MIRRVVDFELNLISTVDEVRDFNLNLGAYNDNLLLSSVEPSLWLLNIFVETIVELVVLLDDFELLRSADSAAERENTTLPGVMARGRVSDSERAVDSVAIVKRNW